MSQARYFPQSQDRKPGEPWPARRRRPTRQGEASMSDTSRRYVKLADVRELVNNLDYPNALDEAVSDGE